MCDIENNLFIVFNKLSNSEYTNGMVNLSNYPLTNIDISVLSKGLGFCPTPGAQDIGNIIQDLEKLDFNYFSLDPIRIPYKSPSNQEDHLNISHLNLNLPSIW